MEVLQHLSVDRRSSLPIETQLARQIERLIASEALPVGNRLPPIRTLARQLGINLHTVRAAYRRLQAQGLVRMEQGRGTTVVQSSLAGFAAARSTTRSFTVGVVIPALAPFYEPVLAGMYQAGANDPSRIVIGVANERLDSAEAHVKHFAGEADGIIVVSQTIREPVGPAGPGFPIVFADWPGSPTPSVSFSPAPIGDLVSHLVEAHGRTDIAMITPPATHPTISPLYATYREALTGRGLPFRDPVEVPNWTIDAGSVAMNRLLESDHPPDAVIGAADRTTLGAVRAAKDHALAIGSDIAIAAYNETDLFSLMEPSLTAVRLPATQLGATAMQLLLGLIVDATVDPVTELTGTLVVRESCGTHP